MTSRSVIHSVPNRVSIIRFAITVTAGSNYHDFTAFGKIHRVIITKLDANTLLPMPSAAYVWNINDDYPQGIAGGEGEAGNDEDNFPEGGTPCQGLNRFTIAGTAAKYLVGIYGEGYSGDWVYP